MTVASACLLALREPEPHDAIAWEGWWIRSNVGAQLIAYALFDLQMLTKKKGDV